MSRLADDSSESDGLLEQTVSEYSLLEGQDVTPAAGGPSTERSRLLDGADESTPLRKVSWVGAEDFVGQPWWRTPSVFWLLGPYFLFTLAFGGTLVPRLNLIIDLVCRKYFSDRDSILLPGGGDGSSAFISPLLPSPLTRPPPIVLGGDNPQCMIPEVQRSVATFTLALQVIAGVLSAVTAPKLGSLSDRYGRKRIMVVASAGGVLAEIVVVLAARFPDVVNYRWMLLGTVCDGLAGSFTAGSIVSHSYVSDCTPPSKRGVAVGYLHAVLFTGLALGPLMAGYFVRWTGNLLSIFYVALGCHVVFILFVLFFTPESLSAKRQGLARVRFRDEGEAAMLRSPWRRRHPWLGELVKANPFAPLRILWPRGADKAPLRRNLVTLALLDTIILGAAMSSATVIILYCESQFGWGNFESSAFVSLTSLVRVIVLGLIFPVINYLVRTRPEARRRRESGIDPADLPPEKNRGADELDIWVIALSIASDLLGVTGYIFVRTPQLFVACAVVAAFGGLGSATIQSALSKHVPPERVGELLGAIGLMHALARVAAPVMFNGLYAATVATFPQAVFVLLAAFFALATLGSFAVRPHVYLKDDSEPPPTVPAPRRSVAEEAVTEDNVVPGL